MLKRMDARPAGLSSSESDDEGFSFSNENERPRIKKTTVFQTQEKFEKQAEVNQSYETCVEEEEERDFQFQVMHACMTGHLETINEYLKDHNANDFLNSGWTPLLYAALSVQPEVIKCLLDSGADVNKHKDGYTPLMALCSSTTGTTEKCLECLELLITAKANVNAANKHNETPLMLACKGNRPELVTELVKYVDNINFTNSEGKTALFSAVTANSPEILKILLENKANIAIKDRHSYLARDIAIIKGYDQVALLLRTESDEVLEAAEVCETVQPYSWRDMFPMLCSNTEKYVNFDISTMLYGMGMERYKRLFEGIDLKTFLKLTEEDLVQLGIDMPFQRKQFLEALHKFHVKSWSTQSIGAIRKSLPYTIYDGVVSLGNAAKQIGVIGSSIRFIKNSLIGATENNLILSDNDKAKYSGELKKTQESLLSLEKELKYMKNLANKINKETKLPLPADYIGPKKRKSNWTIILSVTLILGIYLSRTTYVRRIWNE